MGSRKAAYIATISKIEDIEGKDRIKYISLEDLGWQVIGSAELQVGQKVIYIEYDTIISEENQWAEFLRKRCYSPKYKGYKISAMKMAGKISYGLVLTPIEAGIVTYNGMENGHDLSKELKVFPIDDAVEYETQPLNNNQKMTKFQRFVKKYFYLIWKLFYYRKPESGSFPTDGAIKTDETRIQTLTYLFKPEYKGMPVYVTEKLDGSSATYIYNKDKFIISSRNVKQYSQPIVKSLKEVTKGNTSSIGRNSVFTEMACIYNIPYYLTSFAETLGVKELTIQGELCGPQIQKNKLGLNTNSVFIFNLFDPKERRYYSWAYIEEFCKMSAIPSVPLKEYTTFTWENIPEIEKYVQEDFEGSLYPKGSPREGLVFRRYNPKEMYLPIAEKEQNGCFSFKVINPEFILKEIK